MENNIYSIENDTIEINTYPESWDSANISSSLFNSAIFASGIVAANEIGLLQKIKEVDCVDIDDFCAENCVQEYPLRVLIRALATCQILSYTETTVQAGSNFDEIFSTKGYFTWLIKGYAHSLENMDLLLTAKELKISNVKRNGAFIAKSGKDYGDKFVNTYFNQIFEKLNPKFVADFGCGSADRLINIVKKHKGLKGIGLDINPGAVEVATANIKAANLEDKIEVICSDISIIQPIEKFNDVELIFSFFMGHDLWPKENCLKIFRQLMDVFPNATNFLICDTYRSEDITDFPAFTLGFELTHAFMGQVIPTYSDWLQLFEDLNWTLVETVDTDIPFSTIFNIKIR